MYSWFFNNYLNLQLLNTLKHAIELRFSLTVKVHTLKLVFFLLPLFKILHSYSKYMYF